ncbi:hypothetical protein [Streptomyces sp. NPDC049879]|uniref:hypothetical protein n=1 Tax=Streptomyces sp. NPDC049879 TaxID=3365598 RepID=UPI003792FBD3
MWDPAVYAAVEGKLGAGFEDEPEKLRGLDVLTVNHARSLDGISACRDLRILVLSGCELKGLDELSSLTSLGLLSVSDCAVDSIEAIGHTGVHTVHIQRSRVTDISTLLQCSQLMEVKLDGTDLSDDAYETVIPGLRKSGCYLTFPDETERELTSLLRQSGMLVNYYKRGTDYRLCRPGLSLSERPEVNHPVISPEELREMLSTEPAQVPTLFERSL